MDYLHGSKKRFPVGRVLSGVRGRQDGRHPDLDEQENAVELVLEKFRPAGCMPRATSFFMADSPDSIERAGGYVDHVYLMQPTGSVERNDASWWASLLCEGALDYVLDGDSSVLPECERIAGLYWSGEASSDPAWEFRCESATILSIYRPKASRAK